MKLPLLHITTISYCSLQYLGHLWDKVAHCDTTHPLTLLPLMCSHSGNGGAERMWDSTLLSSADTTRAYKSGPVDCRRRRLTAQSRHDHELSTNLAQNDTKWFLCWEEWKLLQCIWTSFMAAGSAFYRWIRYKHWSCGGALQRWTHWQIIG